MENLNIIVAYNEADKSIGYKDKLIYSFKRDMDFFKEVTKGNSIICGRKTYESFPKRPLPNRENIVLTRQKDYDAPICYDNITDVLAYVESNPDKTFYVCGGAEIYEQFLPYADYVIVTKIFTKPKKADKFFPSFDERDYYYEVLDGTKDYEFGFYGRKL